MLKKFNKKIILVIIFIFSLLLNFNIVTYAGNINHEKDSQRTIRVGGVLIDNQFNLNTEGEYAGFAVDYLERLAKCTGWNYEYRAGTLKECFKWLVQDEVDIVINLNITPDREEIFDFSKYNYDFDRLILLTKSNNQKYKEYDWNSFKGFKVGLIRSSFNIKQFSDYADKKGITYSKQLFDTEAELKRALTDGKVDAICLNNGNTSDDISVLYKFELEPTYIAVKKGNDDLLEELNYGMKEIMDSNIHILWEKYYKYDTNTEIILTEKKATKIGNNADELPLEGARTIVENEKEKHNLLQEDYSTFISIDNMVITIIFLLVPLSYLLYHILMYRNKIKRMTDFDLLTGAKNLSRFFLDAGQLALKADYNQNVLVTFDIKKFSLFNTKNGRKKGDQLLKDIAHILDYMLSDKETFGRVSMDQFVLLLEFTNEDNLRKRMKEILRNINDFNSEFKIRITCGCYILKSEVNMEENFEKALVAHKIAKDNNGLMDIYYYKDYGKDYNNHRNKVYLIESSMERALKEREFILYMQPQYDAVNGSIVGAEVLVRWIKDGEIIFYPNEFISIFEENGFVIDLDYYVFEETCKILKYWLDNQIKPVNISINISRRNFTNQNFPYEFYEIANKYGVLCNYFTLEITENIAMSNDKMAKECQNLLRNFGFKLSIDDFGTGYSALSVLKDLSVDEIKLDKSFFDNVLNDENAKDVVKSIFYLVKKLNLSSVAEGIETKEQIDFLKETDCNIIQGYYYTKPMPIDEINKLLIGDRAQEVSDKLIANSNS